MLGCSHQPVRFPPQLEWGEPEAAVLIEALQYVATHCEFGEGTCLNFNLSNNRFLAVTKTRIKAVVANAPAKLSVTI